MDIYTKNCCTENDSPQSMMIFFHGYTSNADFIVNALENFCIDDSVLIIPNAPMEVSQDIINEYFSERENCRQWYELEASWWESEERVYDRDLCYERLQNKEKDLVNFIDTKLNEYNLKYENLFLAGFSQGATVANYLGGRLEKPCAGVVSFGGFVVHPETFAQDINSRPDVLLLHGDQDEIVPLALHDEAEKFFTENGFDLENHLLQGVGHTINEEMMKLTNDFIKSHILGSDSIV